MTSLRIVADDLTGALDAAAPFATPTQPVHLALRGAIDARKQTISSESRELPLEKARTAVRAAFETSRSGTDDRTLWFKKVDSVLRGWPVEETLELMRRLELPACVFAPAFPEMGRRTVKGCHEVADPDRPGYWSPAAIHDLRKAFLAAGATVAMLGEAGMQQGILIGDAAEAGDLRGLVAQAPRRVLWAGSRGLAEALCFPHLPCAVPPVAAFVLGTSHPVTRRQADHLRAGEASRDIIVIDPVPACADASETMMFIREHIAGMDHPGDRALVVVGGNTLTAVLSAVAARSLACQGEIAPGLPLSIIAGGRFDGVTMITKSGGFGEAELLTRLCAGSV
jgi:D-threonate/D-erythronate kinase